ncbi:hypothetical protein DSS36_15410 [Salmonella enterica subsp. enterica serovar Newport]|nr:hypothetical protein [Salmonella enterica subsp. enterica serovar Newport]EDG9410499.1 hypothetical protein [Salmonella enterica subsp. enterica serovar Tennessee]
MMRQYVNLFITLVFEEASMYDFTPEEIESVSDYLPDSAKTIIQTIGHEKAFELFRLFGGVAVSFSKQEHKEKGSEINCMIKMLIGEQSFSSLCKVYGGERVYIPVCHQAFCAAKNKRVINDFFSRLQSGVSHFVARVEICRLYRISERELHKLVAKKYKNWRSEREEVIRVSVA